MNTAIQQPRSTAGAPGVRPAAEPALVRQAAVAQPSTALTVLVALILLLAIVAAGVGVFYQGGGSGPFAFTTVRGDTVTVYGHGIYRFDGADMVAQAIPQDMVTLVLGVPLLAIALFLYRRGSLRGAFLLAGTLAYFLYTYTVMALGAAFNALFLVYVALFSLSLYAFIMAMLAVDLPSLPAAFGNRLPRKTIAGFLFFSAAFLILAWLGRIVPAQLSGTTPVGMSTSTTLFIQAMDLGVVVPMMVLAAVQLLQRRPFGYLLTAVAIMKFVTMGLALDAMIVGQYLAGVPMTVAEIVIFPIISLVAIVMAVIVLKAARQEEIGV
jgi:hypothetical protein